MNRALWLGCAVWLLGCPAVISGTDGGSGGGSATGGGGGATTGGGAATGGGSATGGGGVIAANPRLQNLADNTALDLGDFICTDPGDQNCVRATDYSGFTLDTTHHQFLMFGGGHSTTMTDTVFAFDLADTLTWKELYPPTPCSQMVLSNLDDTLGAWKAGAGGPYPRPLSIHSYDGLTWVPGTDALVLLSRMFTGGYCNTVGNDVGGPIAHFDPVAKTWTFTTASALSNTNIDATEYDPTSGKIVIFGRSGLSLYDAATKTRTVYVDTFNGETLKTTGGQDADFAPLSYANDLVYFPPNDTFYYFVRGAPVGVFALKLNRAMPKNSTLDALVTPGPTSDLQDPSYAYDSRNQVIGGAVTAGLFHVFDPMTSTWTTRTVQGGNVGSQSFLALGYDPLNNVFVFVTDDRKTWAYRLKN
ncbi:MAG: hypothetical protein U0228_37255 [Myxococcaceae bacterium]